MFKNIFDDDYENRTTDKQTQIVEKPFPTDGANTIFGRRWRDEIIELSNEEIEALKNGKLIALDVQEEYVVFLKCKEEDQ